MPYKHALFLNPYIEGSATTAMKIFPPTGLEYVATSAEGFVDKVTLLDLRYEDELTDLDKLINFISNENIDIVCVGIGWDRQIKEICELINKIPDHIPVIVGGYTATEKVEEFFESCPPIDVIVRGEGEETIQEILSGKPYEDILGISYRKSGEIIHNANRPLPEVDKYVFPDRSLRHHGYKMTFNGVDLPNMSFDTILSSRGCPFNCKFCTFTLNPLGQKRDYSARSVKSVVDELEQVKAKVILFSDENFGVNPKRAKELCQEIIDRGIKKKFIAQTRIEIAKDPELLEKMVQAGFKTLLIGIESPHDRILKQLNKGFDSATVRKYFKVLTKYPIYYHGYFIYGNVTETEDEMLYIADFAKEIGLDSITFLKLRIEKFSPLKELVINTPGYHIASNGAVYSDSYSYDYLKKIGRRIKFSFYTPKRFVHMLSKCFKIKFFTLADAGALLMVLPKVITALIKRDIEKGRLKDSMKRVVGQNA